MPYLFTTPEEQQQMLDQIGASSISELFDCIPNELQLNRDLEIPAALEELQLMQHMQHLATKNKHAGERICFLGGGCYDHFIPAAVDQLAGRGEFYTSYTPYQAEVSQGNLQAIFEYQSMICELTGMDVSNASLYDGGSSCVEAVLMSLASQRKKNKVVLVASVHPEYRQSIETYLVNHDVEVVTVATPNGVLNLDDLKSEVDDNTACVLIQSPNFFGCCEQVEQIAAIAHEKGALAIQSFDPISLGILKRPGDCGIDIAVAEGQSLGSPMSYGGPFLGILTCRKDLVRKMPGRLVGETLARGDKRCWVLTLQTREQHIRRDSATSNICTNQGLYALRASIYMSLLGPKGFREVSENCLRKSHYAADQICAGSRFEMKFNAPFFKEFVVRDHDNSIRELLAESANAGIFAGVELGQWYPDLEDCLLICVTEKRTQTEIDRFASVLAGNEVTKEPVHA